MKSFAVTCAQHHKHAVYWNRRLDLAIASEADPADPEDSVQQLYRPRARPQNIREVRVTEAPPDDVMDTEQEELTTRVANHVRDALGDQFLGAIDEVVKELSEEEDSPDRPTYADITARGSSSRRADIPATGASSRLSECRVAIFHINSYAFRLRFQAVVTLWTQFVSAAVSHQVDYLTGDGNLFANRSFKEQLSYDHNTSILTDIVERVVNAANAERTWETRVTYQLVCSTQHKEWIKSQRGEPGDADCIVGYSFCYGKQLAIQQERAQTRNENSAAIAAGEFQAKENEILLQDKERPKMLINVDLGLSSTDCDWHSPLLAMLKPRATRNWRTRGAPRKAGQVNQDSTTQNAWRGRRISLHAIAISVPTSRAG
eukprot:s4393_g9.t1